MNVKGKGAPWGQWDQPRVDGREVHVPNFSAQLGIPEAFQVSLCWWGRAQTPSSSLQAREGRGSESGVLGGVSY